MTAPLTPAGRLAHSLAWMTKAGNDGPYITQVREKDATTVELVVQDPNALNDPDMTADDKAESHRWIADNAATVLEQTVAGAKLVAVTADGYVGDPGYFSGDEQYFAANIPGVTGQTGEVWNDRNGNKVEEPGEEVYLVPVQTKTDATRIDRVMLDVVNDRPVEFEVDPRPW